MDFQFLFLATTNIDQKAQEKGTGQSDDKKNVGGGQRKMCIMED